MLGERKRLIVVGGVEHEVVSSSISLEFFIHQVCKYDKAKAIDLIGALKMYSSVSFGYLDSITILEDISNNSRVLSTSISKDKIIKTIKSLSIKLELGDDFVNIE